MKRIKTNNKNWLSIEMLNNRKTISLGGPKLPNFNSEKVVAKLFDKKPRCPSTKPDGKWVMRSY